MTTKFLVIGDLHGRKPKIHFKDFDAIIVPGDVCSDKELKPYVKKWFHALKKNYEGSLSQFMDENLSKKQLKDMDKRSLIEGRKILAGLNKIGKPIFFVPGNWDQSYGKTKIKDTEKNDYNYIKAFKDYWLGGRTNPKLIKGLKNVHDCQYQNHIFGGYNILGYGLSSSPENMKKGKAKRKLTDRQFEKLKEGTHKIKDKLEKVYKKRDKKFPTIFITHNIPYNTKLDIIKDKQSYAYKKHLGSWIARKFCEKNQPLICIGAHIHDSFGKDKIKKTIVVNTGYGPKVNTLIELDKNKIKRIKFYGLKGYTGK